jgi:hypothetical protein
MTPKNLTAIIFFVIVAIYSVYQLAGLIREPELTIFKLRDGSTTKTELLSVRGQAQGFNKLLINGEKIALTESGQFETELLLAPGYNIINLQSEDRFGRTMNEKLQLVYEPTSSSSVAYGKEN